MGQRYRDEYGNVWEVVEEDDWGVVLWDRVTHEKIEVDRETLKEEYRPMTKGRWDW